MEYRRKRRVSHQPRQATAYPAYLAVCVVFFGIVYLLSASRAGTWVAKNWIAPALLRGNNARVTDATPSPPPAQQAQATPETVVIDRVTREIVLPAKLFYALQIGAYADDKNAKAQSESLVKIGAAGYILQDGDRYRVLASAYADKESAEKVAVQLLSEGVESRIHTITRAEKRLKITGTGAQIDAVAHAAEQVDTLLAALYEAFIAFDKNKLSVTDGIAALQPIVRQAGETKRALFETPVEQGALAGIDAFFETVLSRLDALIEMDEASAPAFSAALKELYLAAILSVAG